MGVNKLSAKVFCFFFKVISVHHVMHTWSQNECYFSSRRRNNAQIHSANSKI